MIAIMPIYPSSEENRFWETAQGKSLIRNLIDDVSKASFLTKLYVFANDQSFFNPIPNAKTVYIQIDTGAVKESPFLPAGTSRAYRYLKEELQLLFHEFAILGFKNPLLKMAKLDKATFQFRNSNAAGLMSIKTVADNPCQLKAYYQLNEIGFVHFWEPSGGNVFGEINLSMSSPLVELPEGSFLLSRPFFFEWQTRLPGNSDAPDRGTIFFNKTIGWGQQFEPYDCQSMQPDTTQQLWIFEDKTSARHLRILGKKEQKLFSELKQNYVDHTGSMFINNQPVVSLCKKQDDNTYYLIFHSRQQPAPSLTRLFLLTEAGPQLEASIRFDISPKKDSYPFNSKAISKDCPGLLCIVLTPAINTGCDLVEPFPPDKELWNIDNKTGKEINLLTGRIIRGRQDFPEVFSPDGSFFVLREKGFQNFSRIGVQHNWQGFVLREHESVTINTLIDYLRYKAILRLEKDKYCNMINVYTTSLPSHRLG